jgi:hypothetical protein
MIKFYYIDEGTDERLTEETWWGNVVDGEVQTSIDENGPVDTSLEEYVTDLNETILSGVIDPIAVVEHLQYGPIRAVVPSKRNPNTLYDGSDGYNITVDGGLGDLEKYEASKYLSRKSENQETMYKEYELSKEYKKLIISRRSEENVTKIGEVDIETNNVKILNSDFDTQLQTHIEYLLRQTPVLNPVAVTQENTQSRVSGVIDPETENNSLITDPKVIKKSPKTIKNENT